MKTYLITTKLYMKDYYNGDFWIDEKLIKPKRIKADSVRECFEKFIKEIQGKNGIFVSKNAIKNKRAWYNDIFGNLQIGWIITDNIFIDVGINEYSTKYFDMFVEIEELSIPEF